MIKGMKDQTTKNNYESLDQGAEDCVNTGSVDNLKAL